MQRIYQIILIVFVVALAGICLMQGIQLRHIRAQRASIPFETQAKPETEAPILVVTPAPEPLPPVRPSPELTVTEAAHDAEEQVVEEEKEEPPKDRPVNARYAEALVDPERRAMMEARWVIEIDSSYASLFRHLQLPPEQLEQLKLLLLEKRTIKTDFMAEESMPNIADKEAVSLQIRKSTALDAINSQLKVLLGNDAYEALQGYEKSIAERSMLTECKQAMANVSLDMSYKQEDDIIRIMYDLRSSNPLLTAIYEGNSHPGNMTNEQIEEAVREFNQWHDYVLTRTGGILSEKQKPHFEEHMHFMRDFFELSFQEKDLMLGDWSEEDE